VIRYIDARLIPDRLNLVAGGRWSYQGIAAGDERGRQPERDAER
jgi:hypothetical protein